MARCYFFLLLSLLLVVHSKAQVSLSPYPVLTGREGDNLEFSCDGEGQQILQINHNVTAVGGRLMLAGEGSGMGRLPGVQYQLNDLTRNDNGTIIQCFSNGEGSNVITIIVDFPPLYSPASLYYNVIEGSSPVLSLSLDAPVMLTAFTWRRNGIIISSSPGLSLSASSMRFSSVSREDSGLYTVTAVDSLGNGTATISLDVYYAPEFALSPSTDGSNVVNRSVVVGSNTLLNCSVSAANPPVTNSSLNYELTSGSGSASNVDTSTGHFSISSATEANTGRYTCTVTNLVATSELTYNIIVGNLPDVQFTLSVTFSSQSVVINGVFTDNSPYAVQRFHVLVDGTTYTVRVFPLMIDLSQFNVGTTYPVVVSAENIIGNVTVANSSFTIRAPVTPTVPVPSNTPSPTSQPTGGAGALASCGLMAMLMIALSLYSALY
ncbi:PREDICTED: hemicentin-2-like [Amphimedon queenslandica]|nr:PREDICTED: hemicentin-2-like [Amphimedon queenslandica]|eukprot:XP_019852346.1 PREDICTED: hemicentin-2-like [Amphimedon queenslandica]